MIRVKEYYPCVQGEGTLSGTPMWLLRLAGCDVGCPWCDTKESWPLGAQEHDPLSLAAYFRQDKPNIRWVMVTGGEPLLQNLDALCDTLHEAGLLTALETSGTAPMSGTWDHTTVSPKLGMPGKKQLLSSVVNAADEIKMPVATHTDIEVLLRDVLPMLDFAEPTISLQPISLNPKATHVCYQACLDLGWNLSLQQHKFIGAK